MGIEVTVQALPDCDIHKKIGETVTAEYDAKTVWGPWANMCRTCYLNYAYNPNRLGTGFGQHLVVAKENS